ncbi:ABC transporter permease, partial [uncultured Nitratireductor sp.]|uniref:ABC transporter permease n=1 Tax=uncultured Nitratireductor sp. TaxID=520953 RepID=UPI0025CF9B1B
MLAFAIKRFVQALGVMLVVALISFMMFRFVGDPVNQLVGVDTPPAERAALREALGLNDPVLLQFGRFVVKAAQLDFGISYQFKQPVASLIAARLPATLELSLVSALFALMVGVPMGVYTGLHRNTWLARGFLAVSLIGVSLPTFLIGILLIFVVSVHLGWLPSFGRGDTVDLWGVWNTGLLTKSGLQSLILPSITLGLFQMTLIM